jgi:uncharacterized protein
MRIAVVGGSGFIGKHLIRAMAERGDHVMLFSRQAGAAVKGASVESVEWNPEASGPWEDSLATADAVVNLAGKGIMDERWSPAFLDSCKRSRVKSTDAIAKVVSRKGTKCSAWVNASAVGFYGMDTGSTVIDEQAPKGKDVLAEMCHAWERATEAAITAGVRVAKARIGLVQGKEGGMLAQMLPMFNAFVGGALGSGKQYLPWIHITDAIQSILAVLDHKTFQGPFNVSAPEPVTMNEYAKALGTALKRPSILAVPSWALKLGLGDKSQALLGGQRAVPMRLNEIGYSFRFPTVKQAFDDLVQ